MKVHQALLPPELGLGWTPYLWLAYTGFLFFPFLFGPSDSTALAATLATLIVFLPLYFMGFQGRARLTRFTVAGLTLLGMVTATFNSGASAYFIYAASFAGFSGPPRLAMRYVGFIVLAAAVETWLLDLSPVFLAVTAIVSTMVGLSNIYFRQMDLKSRELKASQEEVERLAAMAERERIARDLHDLLGHTLSSVALKAELARKLLDRDIEQARIELSEVERIARNATAEVRQAVSGYRACTVSGEAIRGRRNLESLGVGFIARLPQDLALIPELDNVLGLVLREALTNVARHAGAGSCRVLLESTASVHRLTVEDDGRGANQPGLDDGSGLAGMRERLANVGGSLELDGSPMGGLRLRAAIPNEEPRDVDVEAGAPAT
ncbi:MAG: sensor histidine kinase [Pseudomonadota bacterium]